MKLKTPGFLLLLSLILSCNFIKKDPYKRINQDLEYKLHSIGESGLKPGLNNYLTVHFVYKTITDSIFFESVSKFKYSADIPGMTIGPVFSRISEEDSVSVKVSTIPFFLETLRTPVPDYLKDQEKIIIDMKIQDIQTQEQFLKEKELFLSWAKEFNLSEEDQISGFLNNEKIDIKPEPSGIYYIPLSLGNGKKVEKGRRIKIHYQGRFLNGYFVDDTYKRNAPMDFVFGTEFYIIDGMEEALKKMREGDKSLIIIPSRLAFGSLGSAGGIIPPYTTMIYELEVIKVY
jgi:FKBP-type peptidyl-prolyl cis-trans isomerase FkpA